MSNNYYLDRNRKSINKLNEILVELPAFCSIFFIGVQNTTTPLTRLNYATDIRIFFKYLTSHETSFFRKKIKDITIHDMNEIDSQIIERFMNYLSNYDNGEGKIFSNNECGKMRKLASVRAFFKHFFNKNMLSSDVASKVKNPKLHEKPIIRLEGTETKDLLYICKTMDGFSSHQKKYDQNFKIRDSAIISLFLTTGIRVSECVGLNIDNIDFNFNSFKITRKGGNQVILYFGKETAEILKNYLAYRESLKIPQSERALFLSSQNRRIGVRSVEYIIKKYAQVATPLKSITPHKLRSTYGTNLYKKTKDIYIVAEVLGHKDVNTTKKHYAAISDDIRKSVAGKVTLDE